VKIRIPGGKYCVGHTHECSFYCWECSGCNLFDIHYGADMFDGKEYKESECIKEFGIHGGEFELVRKEEK